MNYEDVQKVSNAAKNKIGLLNTSFLKYFLRAVMAGFFIDVAVNLQQRCGKCILRIRSGMGEIPGGTGIFYRSSSDQLSWRRAVHRQQPGNGIWRL